MSTKNLARTVIEGGRAHFNTVERRCSNASHRAAERQALAREQSNPNYGDVVFPPRQPVYRSFSDKLSPARRWLGSQIGQPWSKVRSELFQRFDTRTTPGRHILFCHLLQMVEMAPGLGFHRIDFAVDAHGILRRAPDTHRFRHHYRATPMIEDWVFRWLGNRRIGERQGRYYWFEPTPFGGFRQGHELTASEHARFQLVPVRFREQQDPLRNPMVGSTEGEKVSWSVVR